MRTRRCGTRHLRPLATKNALVLGLVMTSREQQQIEFDPTVRGPKVRVPHTDSDKSLLQGEALPRCSQTRVFQKQSSAATLNSNHRELYTGSIRFICRRNIMTLYCQIRDCYGVLPATCRHISLVHQDLVWVPPTCCGKLQTELDISLHSV